MKTRELVIFRGLPGSGKSLAAKLYARMAEEFLKDQELPSVVPILEADSLFETSTGWHFDEIYINHANENCRCKTRLEMKYGAQIIIVSNVFASKYELIWYESIASIYGYSIKVYLCLGNYTPKYKVPSYIIENMKARWEDITDPQEIVWDATKEVSQFLHSTEDTNSSNTNSQPAP